MPTKTEFWWVCELASSAACSPEYWCGLDNWTQDPHNQTIKKYTSKEEARAASVECPHAVRCAEHGWHNDARQDS